MNIVTETAGFASERVIGNLKVMGNCHMSRKKKKTYKVPLGKNGKLVVTETHLLLSDLQPSRSHPSTRRAEMGFRESSRVEIHISPEKIHSEVLLYAKP